MAPRLKKTTVAVLDIPRTQIEPDKGQPRTEFDQADLDTLAEMIRRDGMTQPLVVVQLAPDRYRLKNGERRWRAAGLAGLELVPCIVEARASYLDTRIGQVQSNEGRPLSAQEKGQALYNAYLAAQVAALAQEAGQDDPTTALLESGKTAAEDQDALEALLTELTGDTVIAYFTSGNVRVARTEIMARMGVTMSDTAWKKAIDPVKRLPKEVKEAVQGLGVRASSVSLSDLADRPAEEQQDILAQVEGRIADGADPDAAFRDVLAETAPAGADDDPMVELRQAPEADPYLPEGGGALRGGHPAGEGDDFDEGEGGGGGRAAAGGGGGGVSMGGEGGNGFTPDPSLAFLTSDPNAPKMRTDGPAPGRGSVPPETLGQFDGNELLTLDGALETLLRVLGDTNFARLTEAQQPAVRVKWTEIVELMTYALGDS